jgi:hypothetical protein
MKLDRHIPGHNGRGKYALVLMRKVSAIGALLADYQRGVDPTNDANQVLHALQVLEAKGIIDYGDDKNRALAELPRDFFVIRLCDKHAFAALNAYAQSVAADGDDLEYANEMLDLAKKALNANKKKPD